MRIAFGYKARSGKDTCCDYLCEEFGFEKTRIAEKLYDICGNIQMTLNKEVKKDPTLLQDIGMKMREYYGEDIWISSLIQDLKKYKNYCVPDMRFLNDFRLLKENGFILIKIIRDDRVVDRDQNHQSEIELDQKDDTEFDYVIRNNGTIDEMLRELSKIVSFEEFKQN